MFRLGQSRFRLPLATFLVVVALAMRMLVPEGFMLAPGHGVPTLMLCDGMEPAPSHAAMSMHHGDHRSDGGHVPQRPCAFSAAAFAADLVSPLIAPAPVPPAPAVATTRPLDILPGTGLAAPPPWQTGPPAIA